MATIPNAMLLCASSPYAKRGALHDAYQRHFGKDRDSVLVWKAPTRTMNPTVAQSVIDTAMARDASDARAEWLAEFRDDLESFISRDAVLACVDVGVLERPPVAGVRYESFVDPSGGSSDSMTCAIGHEVDGRVIVDCVREVPAPFDPESCVDEFATAFEKRGIVEYRHCELPRSGLYLNLLPHLNSRTVRLLDHPRAVNQIASLERRTARGARDVIDHPRGSHDDLSNAIAGLVYVAAQRPDVEGVFLGSYEDPFCGYRLAQERKRKRFLSLREEAESGIWSARCTLSAEELRRTEPSDETVRRWERQAAAREAKAAAERKHRIW